MLTNCSTSAERVRTNADGDWAAHRVVVPKAVLIGIAYWRRAEILGRPVHIGAGSWACLIAVVTIGVAALTDAVIKA
jgi:hypothetical protein